MAAFGNVKNGVARRLPSSMTRMLPMKRSAKKIRPSGEKTRARGIGGSTTRGSEIS